MASTTSTKTTRVVFFFFFLCAAAAMMISVAVAAEGDEAGCLSIVQPLQPCLEYLRGQGDTPSKSCCAGAQKLDQNAKTTKDRQEACNCIKDAMKTIKNMNTTRIPEIPTKCGITTTLPPIGPDFDCSTIKSGFGGLLLNSY